MNILKNALLYGDATDCLRKYHDDQVDLIVTSPPYDNLRSYEGEHKFNFHDMARTCYRILKPGGVMVWVVGDETINYSETLTSFKQALYFKECGFYHYDTMIYGKINNAPTNHERYENEFEYMFVLSKGGKPKTVNLIKEPCNYEGSTKTYSYECASRKEKRARISKKNRDTYTIGNTKTIGNIWFYAVGMNHSTRDKIAFQHPAIFPEQLARDHIYSWSNPGDLILDPMCGSGTTCKMAKVMKRDYLGIDGTKKYIEIAEKRLSETVIQNSIFDFCNIC